MSTESPKNRQVPGAAGLELNVLGEREDRLDIEGFQGIVVTLDALER